jgi:hypothetical protein
MNPASLAREALLGVTRGEPARQSRSRGVESAVDTWLNQLGIALSDREVRGERAPTRLMDGYQCLPTSHSIRAYLAVLYRL